MAKLSLCLLILAVILNKVSGQAGCQVEDMMFEDGAIEEFECFNNICNNGEWIMDVHEPTCCEHHGDYYPEHDTEAWDCMIHVCMGGHWIPTDEKDPNCHDMDEDREDHPDEEAKGGIVIQVEQIVY